MQFRQILTIGDPVSGTTPPGNLPLSRHVAAISMDVVPKVCLYHPQILFHFLPIAFHVILTIFLVINDNKLSPVSDPQSEFTILNGAVAVLLPLSDSQAGPALVLYKLQWKNYENLRWI